MELVMFENVHKFPNIIGVVEILISTNKIMITYLLLANN